MEDDGLPGRGRAWASTLPIPNFSSPKRIAISKPKTVSLIVRGGGHTEYCGYFIMDRQLESFLKDVWSQRGYIMLFSPERDKTRYNYEMNTDGDIGIKYIVDALNNKNSGICGKIDDATCEKFYEDVGKTMVGMQCKEAIFTFDNETGPESYRFIPADLPLLFQHGQKFYRNGRLTLIKQPGGDLNLARARYTVYVNAKQDLRTHVFLNLAGRVWTFPEVHAAQIACPGNDCADNIHLYCNSAEGMKNVLARINRYAKVNKGYFRPQRRPLTTAVKGLTGVSTSVEPPKMMIARVDKGFMAAKQDQQTFTTYRAHIIFTALERTVRPKKHTVDSRFFNGVTFRKFKARVDKYFRAGGIDPNKPGSQGDLNLGKYKGKRDIVRVAYQEDRLSPVKRQQMNRAGYRRPNVEQPRWNVFQ